MESLGERIKKIRLAKSQTRKVLGEKLNFNCPESRIEEYESGKRVPKKAILSKIAKVLNVSENYLLTGNLDYETIKGMYADGIITKIKLDDSIKPKHYFQLNQLISINNKLIEQCLTQEDYEKIANIIYERIFEKLGSLDDVLPFMTVDEYNDYCADQVFIEPEEIQYFDEDIS